MQNSSIFFAIFLIVICINFQLCYQQLTSETTTCVKNSVDEPVNTFWRQANSHCAKDPHKLIDLYEQIEEGQSTADKCSMLLRHQVRKSLVDTSALIFEEALISQTYRNNSEIDRLEKRLFICDPLVSKAVFERFIDAVYLFVDKLELASILYKNKNFQQMVTSLLHLYWKFILSADFDPRLSSQIAYHLLQIFQNIQFPVLPNEFQQSALKIYKSVPLELSSVYVSKVVRLLNIAHWEYLYGSRNIGPNAIQRVPFTWSAQKNYTESPGDMTLQFNDEGNMAFSNYYDGILRYLYVDENDQKLYFWLGNEPPESRWWEMDYYGTYLTFKNVKAKQLLCATFAYDEKRRYVTLITQMAKYVVPPICQWVTITLLFTSETNVYF